MLAKDKKGCRVVREVEVGEAKDSVVDQIARYLGWFAKLDGKRPRDMLVVAKFPEGFRYAARVVSNLTLHDD